MNNTYMIAAINLRNAESIAAASVDIDFDNDDYDEEYAIEETQAAIDRATADWIQKRDETMRAEILTRAANRAEYFYRNDCGGCGEDNVGRCAAMAIVPLDDGCSHVAALRAAIMSDA